MKVNLGATKGDEGKSRPKLTFEGLVMLGKFNTNNESNGGMSCAASFIQSV